MTIIGTTATFRLSALPRIRLRDAAFHNDPPRWYVYQEMQSIAIDPISTPTTETRRQAGILFGKLDLAGYKLADKRDFFARFVLALKRAIYLRGCVMFPRGSHHCTCARLQVIDAAVAAGLVAEHRSPPGSPLMSRLLPLRPLAQIAETDPWVFDPSAQRQLVVLRQRRTRDEIAFDPANSVAADARRRLAVINAVNAEHQITYEPYDQWDDCHRGERRLRPVHCAIFTDDFQHHGRIYTAPHGHQSLRRLERETICFDGEPGVELDFSGLHCRMLYHLDGIDYASDPYALWGKATTRDLRAVAKRIVNVAISAKDRRSAINAVNQAMNPRTADGAWRTGREGHEAALLRRAVRERKIKIADVYDLALRQHSPIGASFGTDAGMRLMRIDGAIALDVMHCFARRGVPILGCHDSFLVPDRYSDRLRRVMVSCYKRRLRFEPSITDGSAPRINL